MSASLLAIVFAALLFPGNPLKVLRNPVPGC
ncbi:hypothetical protein MGAST_14370 [Mycobacterium gastri 'Wayne']|nr:hypothetical protein MGAST_14370 [Mycobacterium gastri 'Wayne']